MLNFEFLQNEGLTIWIAGDNLRVAPPEKVTPEIVNYIREHKQSIMAELKSSVIYSNPYPQGTTEARRESLSQVMEAVYRESLITIQAAYGGSDLISTDQRLEAVRQAVTRGKAKLEDFQQTVCEWERFGKAELN